MTIFDYLVLVIVICSVVISLLRGLVKEVLSLASWIAALVVANAFGQTLAQWLPDSIPGSVTRLIIACIALFIGVKLLMMLVAMMFQQLIKAGGLTLADRSLGALFGLARGVVIVLSVVLLCGLTKVPQQAFWREAMFSPWFESAARAIKPLLPGEVGQHVQF